MDEYIKRETVIKHLDACMDTIWKPEIVALKCFVEGIPAADVAPVRHGQWVEKEKYTFGIMYDCSLCEDRILDNGHPWNYCPNCGAKMDGGDGNSAMT